MEESESSRPRKYGDPIFDNAYNTGTAEIDVGGVLRVESSYVNSYLGGYVDAYDHHRHEELRQHLYNTLENSKYGRLFLTKRKIPKTYHAELFVFLKHSIVDTSYNNSEVFICIADFLDVSYKTLYDSVPVVYREQVLLELDQEYKMMDDKQSGRLF